MNTSSRRGSASTQERAPPPLERSAVSSASRSVPATRSACPNTAAASMPGARRTRRAAASRSPPVASKMTRPDCAETSSAAPCTSYAAAGEIDNALASLRLVHVMRGDKHGQPFARHVVNQSQNSRRALASTPAVGSSSSKSFGRCRTQAASASRCFQPPES